MLSVNAARLLLRVGPWYTSMPTSQEASWATSQEQHRSNYFVDTVTVEIGSGSSRSASSSRSWSGEITIVQATWAPGQERTQTIIVNPFLGVGFGASSSGSSRKASSSTSRSGKSQQEPGADVEILTSTLGSQDIVWTSAVAYTNFQCPSRVEPHASEVANPGAELHDPSPAPCNTCGTTAAEFSAPTGSGSIHCPHNYGTLRNRTSYFVDRDTQTSPSLALPMGTLSL